MLREITLIIVGFANLATIAFLYLLIKKVIKLVNEIHECVVGLNHITGSLMDILKIRKE